MLASVSHYSHDFHCVTIPPAMLQSLTNGVFRGPKLPCHLLVDDSHQGAFAAIQIRKIAPANYGSIHDSKIIWCNRNRVIPIWNIKARAKPARVAQGCLLYSRKVLQPLNKSVPETRFGVRASWPTRQIPQNCRYALRIISKFDPRSIPGRPDEQ